MRIYWYQGGLQVEPENPSETKLLEYLMTSVKLGESPDTVCTEPGDSEELGSEGLFNSLITAERAGPRNVAGKFSHKQSIVSINKPR